MHRNMPGRGHREYLLLCAAANDLQHHLPVRVHLVPLASQLLTSYRVSGLLLIFVEIPILLRICPTSQKFDTFMRKFSTNYMRAAIYAVMSVVQWVSLIGGASSLIAAAVFLLLAGTFYALAGLRHHDFAGSKTLGGAGIAQMIV